MKLVLSLAAALLLGACEHMYGAADGRVAQVSEAQLIEIASAGLGPAEDPAYKASVTRPAPGQALVVFTPPCPTSAFQCVGGGKGVSVDLATLKVVRIEAYQ